MIGFLRVMLVLSFQYGALFKKMEFFNSSLISCVLRYGL